MPSKKAQPRIVARSSTPADARAASAHPPTVSGRWLATAVLISVAGAALCAWGTLCLLFWQGSWQLLYHPAAAVARTPASVGIAFDAVGLAATETGELRLSGWWVPAAQAAPSFTTLSRLTVLYLHGATGNLGDTVDALARLHAVGVNVLALDYRGYGQSQFAHPSEARWRQDAEWALDYLTATRHVDAHAIVVEGSGLGADLALEVAAAHPELAGVVLEAPVENPAGGLFGDPRAYLVPARLLVSDRYDLNAAAAALRIPSLWLAPSGPSANPGVPAAYSKIAAPKELVRVGSDGTSHAMSVWLDHLRE